MATELKTRLVYDDYCGIAADGKRYELIDGKVHVAPAPSPLHQRVVLRLARTLSDHFTAPAEVQPDVVLVTNPSHVSKRGNEGVPLLVVEVPSPTTTAYSRTTKAQRHASKGEMMKHSMKILAVVLALAAMSLWPLEAWARAGGGSSGGSRGSRSYRSPAQPSPVAPSAPSRQAAAPTSPSQPQRPGFFGGLMGGIGGLLLGGLIGSMLFGGFGGGLFGGIGLVEIVLIGGGILLLMSYMKRRREEPALAHSGAYRSSWQDAPSAGVAVAPAPAAPSDFERGIGHIRQMDPSFDPIRFQETASDLFFKVQAAWASRDMSGASALLTSEMLSILQRDADRLKAGRKINRLENIAVRSVEVTEAWQESGQNYVTVRFLASLLDYTVDESSGTVVEGSKSEPVKFEEYWTFVRPIGGQGWKLSAIQQP